MTSERIAEIKALYEAATSAVWSSFNTEHYAVIHSGNINVALVALPTNANFIATSRQIIPELLEEIEELHKSIEAMAHDLHKWEVRAEEAEQQVKQYQEGFLKKQEEAFYSDMEVAQLTTRVEALKRALHKTCKNCAKYHDCELQKNGIDDEACYSNWEFDEARFS